MPHTPIRLTLGAWRLDLDPALGASVLGFWHGDLAVLRPTPPGASFAGQTAGFPLLPYSNRIGSKILDWQGQRHQLENGFEDGPHALHGVGFQRPWQVLIQDASSARLRLDHPGDASWPFAFQAEQHISLQPDGLQLYLSLTSTDARSQPAGLGWHPYFVRRAGAELHGSGITAQWQSGPDLLPTQAVDMPGGLNGAVAGRALDHCFSGGHALGFSDEVMHAQLFASSAHWVVFTPPQFDFFCLEPVTHVNNAVQMAQPLAHGLVDLLPGQSITQSTALRVRLRG